MTALVLAWVIDRPVQAISWPDKCYILAVTQGIWALPDMYTLGPAALGHSGIHIRQSPHATNFIVVTWALVICLICMPKAQGLRAYISGKSRVPMLQLICNTSIQADMIALMPI